MTEEQKPAARLWTADLIPLVPPSLLSMLKNDGKLRNGRRTPETVYASFDENLDDRSTNFSVTWVPDAELAKFIVEAVNEKLARERRSADPEAWLADQLAHLPTLPDVSAMVRDGWGMMPGSAEFAAVQKLAQEYGEMCAARATADFEDLTIVVKDEGEMKVGGCVSVDPEKRDDDSEWEWEDQW